MNPSRSIHVVRRVTCSSPTSCSHPGPRPRPGAIRCPARAGLEGPRRLRPADRPPGAPRSLADEPPTAPVRSAGRNTTASMATLRCRHRPRNREGDVHPPRPCGRAEDARGIPAKLVVAGMTSDRDPHRGSGRRRSSATRSISIRRAAPVMADFARTGSHAPRCCSEGAAPATAAGVATHRYLGPKLSWSSGRLLNGWALVRIQPVPRRSLHAASTGHRRGRSALVAPIDNTRFNQV